VLLARASSEQGTVKNGLCLPVRPGTTERELKLAVRPEEFEQLLKIAVKVFRPTQK
jgi:hypothetical protein